MDINIMIKTAVDNINEAVDGDAVITYEELLALYEATKERIMSANTVSIRDKAIKVAIRHHISGVEDNELEIYDSICDEGDLEWCAWQPFEYFTADELIDSIDGLTDDIVRTLT